MSMICAQAVELARYETHLLRIYTVESGDGEPAELHSEKYHKQEPDQNDGMEKPRNTIMVVALSKKRVSPHGGKNAQRHRYQEGAE